MRSLRLTDEQVETEADPDEVLDLTASAYVSGSGVAGFGVGSRTGSSSSWDALTSSTATGVGVLAIG